MDDLALALEHVQAVEDGLLPAQELQEKD